MIRTIFLTSFVLLQFFVFAQTDTVVYSIVAGGNIKGFDKIWKNQDGSYEDWYQYNDRGRGDSIRTVFREDEQGFPIYLKASGVDYMKNAVNEEFQWAAGKARWKNVSEDEQRTVSAKMFYQPLKTSGGHLIKALHANNNKLKLLPFGEVDMQVLTTQELKKDGQLKKVWLVQLNGFGLTPSYSWIDEGYNDFASVNEWQSTILRGYESSVNELIEVQKKYETGFFKQTAKALSKPIDEWVLIRNVGVFDAKNAKLLPAKDVLIYKGAIKSIAAGNTVKQAGATIIEGKGKTLLPGLWDMHTHTSDDLDGILHIAAGVTHVRDMGNGEALLARAKDFNTKTLIGPRIEVMSGFIDADDPMAAPTGKLIKNVEEGKKAIQDFAAKGYQQIKLYSSIKPEWVKPLADEAHRLGLRVCGHIPAFMTATKAVEYGYDEITHMNMLALNFFGDTIDTRIPLRFSVPAQRTAFLNLQGPEMIAFIKLLKEKKIAVDPTLLVFEELFTARDKVVSPKFLPIADRLPGTMQRYIKAGGGGLPVPAGMDETYKKSFVAFQKITKLLYDNGIRILPGTDAIAGFGLHRELELYVLAGIPAAKVLQMATWGPAVYTGKSSEVGYIAVGRNADFILVDGNPVQNISNVRKTRLAFTNGMIYDPASLYKSVSVKPL